VGSAGRARLLRRAGTAALALLCLALAAYALRAPILTGVARLLTVRDRILYADLSALRVASDVRRARRRRREEPGLEPGGADHFDTGPGPEDIVAQRRARALLDAVLEAMPADLQTVFVLFELEELPTPDIASLLGIPVGTVASRLRRAREEFQDRAKRLKARCAPRGGSP